MKTKIEQASDSLMTQIQVLSNISAEDKNAKFALNKAKAIGAMVKEVVNAAKVELAVAKFNNTNAPNAKK